MVKIGDLVEFEEKTYEVESVSDEQHIGIRVPGTNDWTVVPLKDLKIKKASQPSTVEPKSSKKGRS